VSRVPGTGPGMFGVGDVVAEGVTGCAGGSAGCCWHEERRKERAAEQRRTLREADFMTAVSIGNGV